MRIAAIGFGVFGVLCAACPASAGDEGQPYALCYDCVRDAIYADTRTINHLEANPDVDDAVKGPSIVGARAEIHRLHSLLGPMVDDGPQPCCYSRPPLRIR